MWAMPLGSKESHDPLQSGRWSRTKSLHPVTLKVDGRNESVGTNGE
ncbi:hypothetical protein [Stygiolobus caldivivus]|nr:hypothetical protein [Stygiolobus caldivivus]